MAVMVRGGVPSVIGGSPRQRRGTTAPQVSGAMTAAPQGQAVTLRAVASDGRSRAARQPATVPGAGRSHAIAGLPEARRPTADAAAAVPAGLVRPPTT